MRTLSGYIPSGIREPQAGRVVESPVEPTMRIEEEDGRAIVGMTLRESFGVFSKYRVEVDDVLLQDRG